MVNFEIAKKESKDKTKTRGMVYSSLTIWLINSSHSNYTGPWDAFLH